ncbi:MAG: DUF1380 family protein [Alphaproteobacteria bacterium]|nr:DUF1380 family protein [Alphaproteobacteria bacterium]
MTTVRDLIAHLQQNYAPDDKIAAAIWQVDDVRWQARERSLTISDDHATEILERIDSNHDGCLGITWETIDFWLDQFEEVGGS